jgi:hypothetical protein
MASERPRLNLWLNLYIIAGVIAVAVVHSRGIFPEDNVVVVGIAYFAGGAAGALIYAGLCDLRDRIFNPKK